VLKTNAPAWSATILAQTFCALCPAKRNGHLFMPELF
jgi:hypothetical protein